MLDKYLSNLKLNRHRDDFREYWRAVVNDPSWVDENWYNHTVNMKDLPEDRPVRIDTGYQLYVDGIRREMVLMIREELLKHNATAQHQLLLYVIESIGDGSATQEEERRETDATWFMIRALQGYGMPSAYSAMLVVALSEREFMINPIDEMGVKRRGYVVLYPQLASPKDTISMPSHVTALDGPTLNTLMSIVGKESKGYRRLFAELLFFNRITCRPWPAIRLLLVMEETNSIQSHTFRSTKPRVIRRISGMPPDWIADFIVKMSMPEGHCMTESNSAFYSIMESLIPFVGDSNIKYVTQSVAHSKERTSTLLYGNINERKR